MTLRLYGIPSTTSLAVHIILEHLELPFELITRARDKLSEPEHLAINPMAQVPVLETEDGLMTESVAILFYIAERYGQERVIPPEGSWERSQMLMRMVFLASQEHPAFGLWLRPFRWLDDEDEQMRLKAAAEKRFAFFFKRLDGWLRGRDWLIGDSMTIADALAFVHARWGLRVEPPTSAYPNIWRFAQMMAEQPAVKRAMDEEGIGLTP